MPQDAVDQFKALPRDRQAALLKRMSPEQKNKLSAAINSRAGKDKKPEMSTGQKAIEVAKGFGKGALETGQMLERGVELGTGLKLTDEAGRKAYSKALESKNAYQTGGKVAEFGAEMLLGGGKAGATVLEKLPNTAKAIKEMSAFEKGVGAAAHVDVRDPLQVAKSFVGNAEMPAVLKDFIKRVNSPTARRLTFEDARGFYLEAKQTLKEGNLGIRANKALSEFIGKMGRELEMGADSIGKLDQYRKLDQAYYTARDFEAKLSKVKKALLVGGSVAGLSYAAKDALKTVLSYLHVN